MIPKVTTQQFIAKVQAAVQARTQQMDVTYGPVYDVVAGVSAVLEEQNDRTRLLARLLVLAGASGLEGVEDLVRGILTNAGITGDLATPSTTTLVFVRSAPPTSDVVVQRGYPIGTAADARTGDSVVFVTTEERAMLASAAASYRNIRTGRYELSVPAVAVTAGRAGRVGADRVKRPLRPLVGFDSVTNPDPAVGGEDAPALDALIDLYFLAVQGTEPATPAGLEFEVRRDFPAVQSLALVYGDDALLERAATDAGAADAWVRGGAEADATEALPFYGVGQLIPVGLPPLLGVQSVTSGATTYVEGADYEVVLDAGALAHSPRATEGVRFLPGGAAPALGAVVSVAYTYDALQRELQAAFESADRAVFGRDLLFRRSVEVPLILSARLRPRRGFTSAAVIAAARVATLAFFETLPSGTRVDVFDVIRAVDGVSGIDNYEVTRLTRATDPTGVADVDVARNEHATLAATDLTITAF